MLLEEQKLYQKKRYKERRILGLCYCGRQSKKDQSWCAKCSERRSKGKKELRYYRVSSGLCTQCGSRIELERKDRTTCVECGKKHNKTNNKRRARYKIEGLCRNCGGKAEHGKSKCFKCRDWSLLATRNLKNKIIENYGGKCKCCGESNIAFLSIDHINNDGAKHRKKIGKGASFYFWLKRNNYPKNNFQVLCYNCNCAKGFTGKCPHQDLENIQSKFISG